MKRAARVTGVVALVMLGTVALLVGSALTLARTSFGGNLVRRLALPRINAAIAGRLELGRFSFGGDRVSLGELVLRDPDEQVVARVREVAVDFSPVALFRGRVNIRRLAIESPSLFLRLGPTGSNLAAALAPRKKEPAPPRDPAPARATSGVTLDVAALRVSDGIVDVQSGTPVSGLPARVEGLTLVGGAHYQTGTNVFTGELDLKADVKAPLSAPLAVRFDGHGRGDDRELKVLASLAGSALAATLRSTPRSMPSSGGTADATLTITRLHVEPALVRAVAPAVRVLVPIDATATVAQRASRVSAQLRTQAGSSELSAEGAFDLATATATGVVITVDHADLGALVQGLPRSDLSLTARGEGGGRDWQTLTGRLAVDAPGGRLATATFGPLSVRLQAVNGRYELQELRASLPGIAVNGRGVVGPEELALNIALDAGDLALTNRTLSAFPGWQGPAFQGRGTVRLSLTGTPARPGLVADAAFPRLVVGDNQIDALVVKANAADARVPQVGSAEVRVGRARLGGQRWHDGFARVSTTVDRLAIDLRVQGLAPLTLAAAGSWRDAHHGFDLERFILGYPNATWTLARPARLTFRPEHLAVSGVDLRAGAQRIRADLDQRGPRLDAHVVLGRIDLGRLPQFALPPGMPLGGLVNAEATVHGTLAHPDARLAITLNDGRVRGYHQLELSADGRYHADRASGHLDARGLGTAIHARFDLPTVWPLLGADQPLELDLTVPETDLARVLTATETPIADRVSGRVALGIHLRGTGAAPTLDLDGAAHALVVNGQTIGDATVRVKGARTAPLMASFELHAPTNAVAKFGGARSGGPSLEPLVRDGSFELHTDLSLATLAQGVPSPSALLRSHFEVTGQLEQLSLSLLGRLAGTPELTAGTASVRLSASGTGLAPTGAVSVTLSGAAGPRFPATDARLDATASERDTRVALRVLRAGRHLGSGSVILGVPARDLLAGLPGLGRAPITMRAAVGPLQLHRTGLPTGLESKQEGTLSAPLQASVSVDGTLDDPDAQVVANLATIRLGDKVFGSAHALASYRARRANLDVRLSSASGGELRLTDRTAIDLGLARLRRGVDLGALALDARIDAHAFDLSWLSGITEDVRSVAGDLSAAVTVRGAVLSPDVQGKAEWKKGGLTLTGLGRYDNIHLAVHGTPQAIWLEELSLHSGEGNARVVASALRQGSGGYALDTQVALRRFPIYGQGLVLGVVSVDGSAKGAVSGRGWDATVRIADAHAELTDAKRKDLQDLGRPADVVLVQAGKPVDEAEAAALARALQTAGMAVPAPDARVRAAPLSPRPAFTGHLRVQAPRNLWVRGKDASLELGLAPDFRMEVAGAPRIYGTILIKRGRVDVLGRRFDLQAGSDVRFTGPPDQPRLNVTAKYINETENITVLLSVTGTLDKLTIAVSSPDRPDLTEGQLYALVVTGRLQMGGNTAGSATPSSEAASLVGGLLAAQLQKTLSKRLPLDVLSLQAGNGASGSRLEAGTYLTSKLYAGYVGRVGANPALLQNRNAVHVEYQLSRRWSFDGEYGDVGTGTADLFWTKHY